MAPESHESGAFQALRSIGDLGPEGGPSSRQQSAGRQHDADARHLLHPQHDRGPLCAGTAFVGSQVSCMYYRIF